MRLHLAPSPAELLEEQQERARHIAELLQRVIWLAEKLPASEHQEGLLHNLSDAQFHAEEMANENPSR